MTEQARSITASSQSRCQISCGEFISASGAGVAALATRSVLGTRPARIDPG